MSDAPRPSAEPTPAHIVTDPDQVERRARDLADQNVHFRSWVKFRCKLPDADLDATVCAATDEVWAHIDCIACARCCRYLQIVVDRDDASRLARRLGMGPAAFLAKYVRTIDGCTVFAKRPCPFLREGACTVYEDRPKACRDFPYLHETGFRDRMLVHIENSVLCPIVFNVLQLFKRRLPWRRRK